MTVNLDRNRKTGRPSKISAKDCYDAIIALGDNYSYQSIADWIYEQKAVRVSRVAVRKVCIKHDVETKAKQTLAAESELGEAGQKLYAEVRAAIRFEDIGSHTEALEVFNTAIIKCAERIIGALTKIDFEKPGDINNAMTTLARAVEAAANARTTLKDVAALRMAMEDYQRRNTPQALQAPGDAPLTIEARLKTIADAN